MSRAFNTAHIILLQLCDLDEVATALWQFREAFLQQDNELRDDNLFKKLSGAIQQLHHFDTYLFHCFEFIGIPCSSRGQPPVITESEMQIKLEAYRCHTSRESPLFEYLRLICTMTPEECAQVHVVSDSNQKITLRLQNDVFPVFVLENTIITMADILSNNRGISKNHIVCFCQQIYTLRIKAVFYFSNFASHNLREMNLLHVILDFLC